MTEVNAKSFNELIQDKAVVDFSATWCGPCKSQESILNNLSSELNDIKFAKVDVDSVSELAKKYDIQSVPTIIFFEKGLESKRFVGLHSLDNLKKELT
jgi:thioredoxin 1